LEIRAKGRHPAGVLGERGSDFSQREEPSPEWRRGGNVWRILEPGTDLAGQPRPDRSQFGQRSTLGVDGRSLCRPVKRRGPGASFERAPPVSFLFLRGLGEKLGDLAVGKRQR
jgi:hypothetical protein